MSESDPKARLEALEAKINAAKKAEETEKRHQDEHYSQAQQGWRMVIEMVAGVLIGFGMGYGLDRLFGTLPIFLVIFTLLGFIAGVRTMMRTAKEFQEEQAGASPEEDNERT
ncbi:AtpZ/AtpI family protein [Alisedimentitalea sp. MJ-SS2]|uniref:AtpZ/AtpI family protein n=1 Tax=Aliisedimentitalea sp. MJ-SS2 TaxID=3049795 RepID=UPI00290FD273|nr:AtpZ/AtpI family protein [Alisedimentitalea sp. MJ-SS2]MDU8927567.1 AtpZ/AtpI family protein [Alisedimentitalea sp. MJ-SS2]